MLCPHKALRSARGGGGGSALCRVQDERPGKLRLGRLPQGWPAGVRPRRGQAPLFQQEVPRLTVTTVPDTQGPDAGPAASQSSKGNILSSRRCGEALASVARGLRDTLQWERSPVSLPVRAQAWAAGSVPGGARTRGSLLVSHTWMFLSLSSSFPVPLPEDKMKW